MPTYVYRCDSCNHQFELYQRMADDPLDTCPECQGKVRRVIHPVGVVFKGSGWYINDSRSNGSNDATSKAKEKSSESSSSSSDSTPAKSEPAKTAAD